VNEQDQMQLTRAQMLGLLEWEKADACVTDDMLRVAVENRLRLRRLRPEDLQQVAA
jgi:hypothetical protein